MNNSLQQRYQSSLSLLTDLYQLTMAYGYWKTGRVEEQAVFHLYYRKNPFGGSFALAAGLEDVVHWLQQLQFDASDISYLASLTDNKGQILFEQDFLDYLGQLRFTGELHAIPEGTIVFANQPLLRITAPLLEAQLIETALLTLVNFPTLIATKAARIVQAAQGDAVLEFGLRRAQGIDGGLTASRSAYIGGCAATSNLLAGKIYGIPVKGTHSHSWVMSFAEEQQAFEAYAQAMPDNCLFLVDTYATKIGIQAAINIGLQIEAKGHDFLGIRLDSGDLASLSQQARQALDAAGLEKAIIVASDGLDEYKIQALKKAGAPIAVWGVGTNLVTAQEQPSLGGVYKLAAIKAPNTPWQYKMKVSDAANKISTPGILQVRRYFLSDGQPFGDMIWNSDPIAPLGQLQSFDGRSVVVQGRSYEDLLQPILKQQQLLYPLPSLESIRQRAQEQLALFESVNFKWYPIGLEEHLNQLKLDLLQQYFKT
ncbi:MAG: nicotinate phosphoribosyltransferase [Aureispira sp.]